MHLDALTQVQRSLERALAPHLNDADRTTAYASNIARLYADITCIQDTLSKIITHKNASAEEFQTLQAALCKSWPELTNALAALYGESGCRHAQQQSSDACHSAMAMANAANLANVANAPYNTPATLSATAVSSAAQLAQTAQTV